MKAEITMYEAQKKKMEGLCEEHQLSYRFHKSGYPMTFTIKPLQGMDAQIDMLESVEDSGYRSPDASMMWIFHDGVLETKVTGGTFTISKTLRGKIESVLMKMITYWQQYFFRDVMENDLLRDGTMPVISEEDMDDAEPIEETEDDEDEEDIPEDLFASFVRDATDLVRAEDKVSAAFLQRRLKFTHKVANEVMQKMEEDGVIEQNADGTYAVSAMDVPEDEEFVEEDEGNDVDA